MFGKRTVRFLPVFPAQKTRTRKKGLGQRGRDAGNKEPVRQKQAGTAAQTPEARRPTQAAAARQRCTPRTRCPGPRAFANTGLRTAAGLRRNQACPVAPPRRPARIGGGRQPGCRLGSEGAIRGGSGGFGCPRVISSASDTPQRQQRVGALWRRRRVPGGGCSSDSSELRVSSPRLLPSPPSPFFVFRSPSLPFPVPGDRILRRQLRRQLLSSR
ncbi:PREDICTED: uncharacterized protein LOC102021119 [Chinchilla lanigera]|uniref:uncharacterized protein LOC102021119 n=1 Tax=Chinchilla lanigera TaxID=34839 RepID=UPI0006980ECA|nr:PREDICTED: uncharacterized protein LOC102021119 [Chinchilla lanigera]